MWGHGLRLHSVLREILTASFAKASITPRLASLLGTLSSERGLSTMPTAECFRQANISTFPPKDIEASGHRRWR